MKVILEILTVVAIVVGGIFSMFWLMEERHAQKQEVITLSEKVLLSELEVRDEIIDTNLKELNTSRIYYENISKERPLNNAEISRLEYLISASEKKYKEQEKIQDRLYDLKKINK